MSSVACGVLCVCVHALACQGCHWDICGGPRPALAANGICKPLPAPTTGSDLVARRRCATANISPQHTRTRPSPLQALTESMQPAPLLAGERSLWSGNLAARRVKLYKQQQQQQQQQERQRQQQRPAGSGLRPSSAPLPSASQTSPTASSSPQHPTNPAHAHGSSSAADAAGESGGSHAGAPSSSGGGTRPRGNALGPHNPIRQYLQRLLPPHGHHAGSGLSSGEEEEEEEAGVKEGGRARGGLRGGQSGWLSPDADQVGSIGWGTPCCW